MTMQRFFEDDIEVMQIISRVEWYCLRVSIDDTLMGLAENLKKIKEIQQ